MPVSTHFFLIHLLAFVALLINIGPQQDGWDNLSKKFTLNGKIATTLIVLDLAAFIHFLLTTKATMAAYGSIYLGYSITVVAFSIPFTAISHYKSSLKPIKINMVGWIGIALGASGFVSSLFLVAFSKTKVATNMSEDYVAILGHFITVASAMIALTEGLSASAAITVAASTTEQDRLKAEDRKWEKRDLKRVAIKVIMIGFVVSAVNSIIENRKEEEVKKNLLHTKKLITDSLDTHISQLDVQIKNTKGDLGKVHKELQGLLATVKTLGKINSSLEELNRKVAKKNKVDQLLKKSTQLDKNDAAQKKALEALNKDLSQQLDKYNQLTEQLSKNDQSKQKAIDNLKNTLSNYNKNLTTLEQTVKNNTDLKQLGVIVRGQQNMLDRLQKGMLTKASLNQLTQNVQSLKGRLQTFENRIATQLSKLKRPLVPPNPVKKDTVK